MIAVDPATAASIPIAGSTADAAERFHAYAQAGATHLAIGVADE